MGGNGRYGNSCKDDGIGDESWSARVHQLIVGPIAFQVATLATAQLHGFKMVCALEAHPTCIPDPPPKVPSPALEDRRVQIEAKSRRANSGSARHLRRLTPTTSSYPTEYIWPVYRY